MYFYRKSVSLVVVLVATCALVVYWTKLMWLRAALPEVRGELLPSGFISWLFGWLSLAAGILLLGWLNHRLVYSRMQKSDLPMWWYLAWQMGLCWLIFEFLQWRTEHDARLLPENILVSLVISGLIYLLVLVADAFAVKRKHRALEGEKIAAELRALRNQLNPHFLFNALNTIYSESLSGNAQNSARLVHDLSGILRFALQQSQHDWVKSSEEIDFLQKYVGMHRERLPQQAREKLVFIAAFDQEQLLPPLLLLPFVENAIQYGMHSVQPAEVFMRLTIEDEILTFESVNAVYPALQKSRQGTGHGISNVKQRLGLLYPNGHELQIAETDQVFRVTLKINLN